MGAPSITCTLGLWLGVFAHLGCARQGGSHAQPRLLTAAEEVSVSKPRLNTVPVGDAAVRTSGEQTEGVAPSGLAAQVAGASDADSGAPASCEAIRLPHECTELFTLERCHGLELVLLEPDAAARIVECLARHNKLNPCFGEAFGMCAVETRRESAGTKEPSVMRGCRTAQHICQTSPSGSVDFSQCSDTVGQLRPQFRSAMLQCLRRTCNRYSCFEDVLRKRFPKFP